MPEETRNLVAEGYRGLARIETLGTQALAVERARQAAKALRERRSGLLCSNAEDARQPQQRCYNRFVVGGSDWCETCRERERVHRQYHAAANVQRVERMKLTKWCQRTLSEWEEAAQPEEE